MRPDEQNIEQVLQRALPSAPRGQMEAALDRVYTRLHSDRGWTVPDAAGLGAVPAPRWPWRPAMTVAATALVVAVAVWAGSSWRDRAVYAVLETGERIGEGQTVQSNERAGAVLTLADGSRIEMRAQSELAWERADDGMRVRLHRGGIVVNAAKQRRGHLYVETDELTVAVVGTVFVVNADDDGSRVAVIEGEVRVNEGTTETTLGPGQLVSTNRVSAARSVAEEIAWSRQADTHLAILATFTKGMALTAGPLMPLTDGSGPCRGDACVAPTTAQVTAARPEFEEASIRPCDPDNIPPPPPGARGGGANSFQMTPGRTHALCLTLATIIRHAYGYGPASLDFNSDNRRGFALNTVYGLGVEDGLRVRGGPDWVRSEHYTIDAVAPDAADAATMQGPMMRALLERRFQLKAHIEAEQVPGFALTVAPGGVKLKPVSSGACEMPIGKPGAPLLNGVPMNLAAPPRSFADVRRGAKPTCGQWGGRNGPNQVWVAGESTFADLTQQLGFRLGGVRVLDKTGVTDKFNWILEFVLDENTPGVGVVPQRAPESPDVPRAATLFVAIEEQLGLKLDPARAPRDFIVIDQVERLSPN